MRSFRHIDRDKKIASTRSKPGRSGFGRKFRINNQARQERSTNGLRRKNSLPQDFVSQALAWPLP